MANGRGGERGNQGKECTTGRGSEGPAAPLFHKAALIKQGGGKRGKKSFLSLFKTSGAFQVSAGHERVESEGREDLVLSCLGCEGSWRADL